MSPFYRPSGPRLPADGIRARTARGSIGEQWWSRRFIDVLEELTDPGRLSRGRSYARSGQVLDLTVRPYQVTARVQGTRPSPYRVTIGLDPIDEQTWSAIEAELASRAVFRARLLAGELPIEIEGVFADLEAPLFPESADDLSLECSCPDWGWPCKHAAAVLYVLAEAFDDDPFLILAWNGRDRDTLLATLRSEQNQVDQSGQSGGSERSAPDAGPLGVRGAPLEECLDAYWTPSSSLTPPGGTAPRRHADDGHPSDGPASGPPAPADLLLRLLDPPPITVRGESLVDLLRPGYTALGE